MGVDFLKEIFYFNHAVISFASIVARLSEGSTAHGIITISPAPVNCYEHYSRLQREGTFSGSLGEFVEDQSKCMVIKG